MKSVNMININDLKEQGWVSLSKFAQLIDRAPCTYILKLARRYGVRIVSVNVPGLTRCGQVHLFHPEDAGKIPPKKNKFLEKKTNKEWISRGQLSQVIGVGYHQIPKYVYKHKILTKIFATNTNGNTTYLYSLVDIQAKGLIPQTQSVPESVPQKKIDVSESSESSESSKGIQSNILRLKNNKEKLRSILSRF